MRPASKDTLEAIYKRPLTDEEYDAYLRPFTANGVDRMPAPGRCEPPDPGKPGRKR